MLGSIDVDGRSISSPQERRLLAVLLLHRGRSVSVSAATEAIWGDDIPEASRASLQSKISRLRAVVGHDRIDHGPGGYTIRTEAGEYDADEFETLAYAVSKELDPVHRVTLATEALLLWRGPLCGELSDEEFVGGEGVRLEQLRSTVAERRASALIETGRFDEALADIELLARQQPYHDRLCELRMTALACSGRIVDALRCFADYQKRLIEEVGVVPTQTLADLERQILQPDFTGPTVSSRSTEAIAPLPTSARNRQSAEHKPRALELRGNRWNAPIVMRPAFVGREDTIATIRRLILRFDGPRCCFVSGDGGIGKSRVAIESAAFARRIGRGTLLIQCRRPPTALFAALNQSIPTNSFEWSDPSSRERLVASHSAVLRARLEPGSLLVIEDLHWADEGTLAVLSSLAATVTLDDTDVAWLLTSRPTPPDSPQAEAIDRLLRDLPTTTIQLDGLSEPETFQLIRHASDVQPKLHLSDLLHKQTDGNPLLALTGLQSLRSSGELRSDGRTLSSSATAFRSVPSELTGSLDHVISQLDPITYRILQDLALTGGTASIELLASLSDLPPSQLIAALSAAEVVGLAEVNGQEVRFTHDLYCRVVEEHMSRHERDVRHHAAYIRLLPEPTHDLRTALALLPTARLLQLAHHAAAAGHVVPRTDSFEVFSAAAFRSLVETDWTASARYYRRARDIARDCPLDDNERLRVDAYAGAALFRAHDATDAVPLLDDVIDRAAELLEMDLWAQALADHGRATVFLSRIVARPDSTRIERFIRSASTVRPEDCARLLALAAEQQFSVGDNLAARDLIERARTIAPRGASALLRAELAFAEGLTWLGELRLAEAADQFERCIADARTAKSSWVLSWGLGRQAFVKLITGELAEANVLLREARATQIEAGSWSELSFTATLEAHVADLRSDDETTESLISQAERLLVRSGYAFTAQFLYPLMMQRAARAGDIVGANGAATRWTEFAHRIPRIFRALNFIVSGDSAKATSELSGWRAFAGGPFGPGHLTLIAAQHRCAAMLGDDSLREATAAALSQLAERGVRLLPGVGIDLRP